MNLYGIGHAMVDIFCFSQEIENMQKNARAGFVFPSPLIPGRIIHLPPQELDELLLKLQVSVSGFVAASVKNCVSGGTAANILKTAAALGNQCFFSGTAGAPLGVRDDYSLLFQKEIASYGVQATLRFENTATGRFLTVIAGQTRAMAGSPGAAMAIQTEQIDRAALAQADYVVAEGMLCLNEPVWKALTELSQAKQKALVIDAATPFAAEKLYKPLSTLIGTLPLIFFVNETETASFASGAPHPTNFAQIATQFTGRQKQTLFVEKLGAQGSRVWQNGTAQTINTPPQQALDATGAGDAFAAAFLTALHQGISAEQAAFAANSYAATTLNHYGCVPQKTTLKL